MERIPEEAPKGISLNWITIACISLGWLWGFTGSVVISEAITRATGGAITATWPFDIALACGGAIVGLAIGLWLRHERAIATRSSLVWIVLGWAIAGTTLGAILQANNAGLPGDWAIAFAIAGTIGGLSVAVVLRDERAISSWWSFVWIMVGWAIGWPIGGAVSLAIVWAIIKIAGDGLARQPGRSDVAGIVLWAVFGAISGAIGGIIGESVTAWQFAAPGSLLWFLTHPCRATAVSPAGSPGTPRAWRIETTTTSATAIVTRPGTADGQQPVPIGEASGPRNGPREMAEQAPLAQSARGDMDTILEKAPKDMRLNWITIACISLGWLWGVVGGLVIGEAISRTSRGAISGPWSGDIVLASGGAIVGLAISLWLRNERVIARRSSVVWIVLGWAIAWPIGNAMPEIVRGIGWLDALGFAGFLTIGGLSVAVALRNERTISSWWSFIWILVGWAIGWPIGGAVCFAIGWAIIKIAGTAFFATIDGTVFVFVCMSVFAAISGAIGGVIGESVTAWQLRRARKPVMVPAASLPAGTTHE